MQRFESVLAALQAPDLAKVLQPFPARDATRQDLRLVHTVEYLALAEGEVRSGEEQLSTGDTTISLGSWEAALKAAGSGLAAVDAVMDGHAENAFCVVRPPGHHAGAARGMGFCILNNIAIAARHAQQRGARRVLIVDWDVHHGNGTQDIFYEDGSVFFFSTHQSPWYPGTGRADETGVGAGKGTTLNCPLPAGSGRAEIWKAFAMQLLPAADAFKPDFVLISAGFDSRENDPLGHFKLTDADFSELTRLMRNLADRHAKGRIVSMLEGGYNLSGVASAARAHVEALATRG
ncbi:MAG: histone deacetylase superfamily [Chthoniobacter sp.]|nr:histone deacetylase superfamily [Chthoniobacter sp.]